MRLEIVRVAELDGATLGIGVINGFPEITVIEREWRNNERNVSCIPPGRYKALLHQSPKFGQTYWLQDVPGRSEILIHPANWAHELQGCIAVGGAFKRSPEGPMVTNSVKSLVKLFERLDWADEIVVQIRESYGP